MPLLDKNIWNSEPVKTAALSLTIILGRPNVAKVCLSFDMVSCAVAVFVR